MLGALLLFVVQVTPDDVRALVEQLGSDDADVRQKASEALSKIGKPAVAELEKAARAEDLEVRKRAERLLKIIALDHEFSPEFQRAIPGLVDLVVNDDWKELFEKLSRLKPDRFDTFRRDDLVVLMRSAARSGIKGPLKAKTIDFIAKHGMRTFIPELVAGLEDPDPLVRQKSIYALNQFQAWKAAPQIAGRLADADVEVRKTAASSLGFLRSKEHWRQLVELLKDNSGPVRANAVMALGNLKAKEAVPALWDVVRQGGPIATYAIAALGDIGADGTIGELRKLLSDRDPQVRSSALWALDNLEAWDRVPDLIRLTADEDAQVRQAAANHLGRSGSQDAMPELLKLLEDPEKGVREAALGALVDLGAPEAWPILLEELARENPDRSPRSVGDIAGSCVALKKLGLVEKWRDLLPFLRNRDSEVRRNTAEVLGALKPGDAVPEIEKLLGDDDAGVREAAVRAIRALGAKGSVPRLLKLLDDGDSNVRQEVLMAFKKLGASEVIPDLIRHLKSGAEVDRMWTLYALGELNAKEAIPDVRKYLGDSNVSARKAAIAVAGNLGDGEAVAPLIKLLDDPNYEVRIVAIPALARLKAKEAWPEIAKRLKDDHRYVRQRAAKALGDLGVRESWPALAEALSMECSATREEVLDALRRLNAVESAPSIIPLLDDQHVREKALDVLARFGRREALDALLQEAERDDAYSAADVFKKLNLLRWVDFYETLKAKKIADPGVDTVGKLVEIVREVGGVEVEARPPLDKAALETKAWLSSREPTLIDALFAISWRAHRVVLLEGGRVTLLPREEGLKIWRDWAAKNK